MYSIKRHIEPVVKRRAKNSKAIVLTGPRQVGKSTLFKYLFSDIPQVTFDDDLLLAQEHYWECPSRSQIQLHLPCPLE